MKRIVRSLQLCLLAVATACAGAQAYGPSFAESKPTEMKADMALVIVYRHYAEPTMWSASVVLDGKLAGTLDQKGYTWFYARPGHRELKGKWAPLSGQSASEIALDLQAGKTYYVELFGISQFAGLSGKELVFQMGSGMVLVGPERYGPLLEQCKFQKPVAGEL